MFQFGRMLGGVESHVYMRCRMLRYETPRVWKEKMGLSKDKDASLRLATRVFGEQAALRFWPRKKDEGVAEAALLALYWARHKL